MSKYNVLWVDDDWSDNADKTNYNYLSKTRKHIDVNLKRTNIEFAWALRKNPEEGVVELRQGMDFRMAIIDLMFSSTRFNINPIINELDEKRIPYIIFTHFKANIEQEANIKNKELLLGAYQKGLNDDEFIHRIISFIKAPPFRILHLSDFHFKANQVMSNMSEQDSLLKSMIITIKEEHKRSPLDGIFITGDFVSDDPGDDFIGIKRYIIDLIVNTITIDNLNRLFIVPGNHDIHWLSYSDKQIAANPLYPYLEFYKSIYINRLEILREISGWDITKNDFKQYLDITHTLWHRKLYDPLISVIGLSTPTLNCSIQGKGEFNKDHQEYIDNKWCDNRQQGEVRIALMHHNIFSSLSINNADEKDVLYNSGDALYTLLKHRCNIVLTGHTHSPGILSCKVSNIRLKGYDTPSQILIISSGSTGGLHPAGDRPRSFNIIDVFDANIDSGIRKVCIRPYIYESAHHEWNDTGQINFEI